MVQRARRTLQDHLVEATSTITNPGSLMVDAFTPIITPPQAAVLTANLVKVLPSLDRAGLNVKVVAAISPASRIRTTARPRSRTSTAGTRGGDQRRLQTNALLARWTAGR
jgi:hypothetical protein